jgi:hypothetical protein
MGGIGGGIGGYTAAPTAAGAQAPVYDVNAAGQIVSAPDYVVGPSLAAQPLGSEFNAYAQTPTAAVADMSSASELASFAQAPATPTAGLDTSGLAGAMAAPTTQAPTAGTAGTAGTAAAPQTYSEALRAKFTNPKNLADMTLRAAGQLAGSALAGSGLSSEEEALLGQQTEELRQLQQTNQALFNQRLEQAQNLAGESKYFDPEYFGLQSSRRAQTQGAVAKRAGLRGLTGDRREAEARRFDIESGRRTGTAYDVGFGSAISPRLQTMQAGLSLMPTSGPSVNYSGLQNAYTSAARRQRETQQDIGNLFGSLTSNAASRG